MAGDPLWYYKVLGLHCDGTNGSTTFTDVKGKTVTANGNAQISTAQYPALTGKTSSGYFDGTGDYLSIPDSADWAFGSGDFTLRAHIRLAGYATNNAGEYQSSIVSQDISTSRSFLFNVAGTSSSFTTLHFAGLSDNSTGYTIVSGSYSFALNTWYLVEVCRVGNYVYLFVDGVLLNTGGTAFSRTLQDSSTTLKVGAQEYDATYKYYLNGYISEVEIYKGVGLHTASYTPSTDPFADEYLSISGTVRDSTSAFASRLVRVYRRDTGSLVGEVVSNESTGTYKVIAANSGTTTPLKHFAVCHDPSAISLYRVLGLHCDGTNGSTTFTDVCGKTVTANGNAQISTAQYPALTGKTSSGYFDGSGDYLSIPDSASLELGYSDFTFRARIRIAGYSPSYAGAYYFAIFAKDASAGRSYNVQIVGTSSSFTTLRFNGFSDNTTSTTVDGSFSFALNTWYDVEVSRSGNLVYLFIDGTLLNAGGTAFSRTLQDTTQILKIGGHIWDGTYLGYFNGYISEVEIYKGIGLHTADFTPSTIPFTDSTTATENALIYDDLTPT